ncbi:DNA (cytosine-5-)-methyltransferase [Mesorhizobium sp. M1227]|uniref:DNA cytosine methyltransferase n=1 Tax=Mesorhizobium sp. M1227 TaxID=2957071 RepID=UPI003338B4C3
MNSVTMSFGMAGPDGQGAGCASSSRVAIRTLTRRFLALKLADSARHQSYGPAHRPRKKYTLIGQMGLDPATEICHGSMSHASLILTGFSLMLRAIDLYSGVGGWSLGLRLAGIEVVASYERWGPANETNFKNNFHQAQTVDIRRLSLDELPSDIDIVVGSPPCTQFSYSNRGGGGDLEDGLVDIVRFLTIVDHLKPRVWAMENVPRVAPILLEELKKGGRLHRFKELGLEAHIVNMADFGLPQRRRRCIAGNFDFKRLSSYAGRKAPTLGEVVDSLNRDPVIDPLFGVSIPKEELFDHDPESPLNDEEVRINRATKTLHPIYNAMPFPDPLDRTVRTITATCTRVSRESIIVSTLADNGAYRRLTIRERATLQGFPITFQFYGANNGQKLRMVGNAIPPLFAYFAAQSFLGTPATKAVPLTDASMGLVSPTPKPDRTASDTAGARFPENRTFRFAIPSLRLKSGVRFELRNQAAGHIPAWCVSFWFGTSKAIKGLDLEPGLAQRVLKRLPAEAQVRIRASLEKLESMLANADFANMQKLWSHRGPGQTRPFMILDELDCIGDEVRSAMQPYQADARTIIVEVITAEYGDATNLLPGLAKLDRNAVLIATGLIVGSISNRYMLLPKGVAPAGKHSF